MAKGALWMVLFKFVERTLGLISTVILARLLVPADFGIVAMATSVVYALDLLNSFSFEMALIQQTNITDKHFDTAWTFRIIFGLVVGVALIFLAGPAEQFFNEPDLLVIILCLAFGVVAESFQNIGTVRFQKDLEFSKEFVLRALVKLIAFATTVPLAFYLRNYWALVAGMVVGRLSTVVLSYVMHPYRPWFSVAAWRDLFGFSIWLFLNNIIMFLRLRSADFVIGRTIGAAQLGLFSVAYEIAHLASSELVMPINRAVFPGFSKIASDRSRLRQEFLNVIGVTCLFAIPAGLGVAAVAELIVPILLGDKWLDAIPLIRVLALHGIYGAMTITMSSAYLALGRPRVLTVVGSIYVIVLLALLLYMTPRGGPMGAAYATLITALLMTPIVFTVLLRVLELRLKRLISSIWRPALAATLMYFAVRALLDYLGTGETLFDAISILVACFIGGIVTYSAALMTFWQLSGRPRGAEGIVMRMLAQRISGRADLPVSEDPRP